MAGSKFIAKLSAFFVFAAICSLPAVSQLVTPEREPIAGQVHTTAVPQARVVDKVDNSKRTTLTGHVPSTLRTAKDMGRIDGKTQAQHLVLVLKSSDDQERELRKVLDEQQDKSTANYHQWLTPDQFGEHFGVDSSDIAKVSDWLASQGFTVEDVSKSKRVLHFSGTTSQIESAFKTEMHTYTVGSETHVSNNSEISVPTALRPVIGGLSLNNFFRKGHMGQVRRVSDAKLSPDYTNGATSYVGPADFATIYNTQPMLTAGTTGTGSSIAVVGRSDILLSDVQTYRQLFGLPVNDPIFIHAGQDNGVEPGDDGESDLDVEISGGIAPNAKVYFVIGTPTFLVDGITNSIEYIVENNLADIMSISYGSCESVEGDGGNAFNMQAFEQAAAQGISVFVASGDNGPAECDDSNDTYETGGYATGAESSTPYSVSVGGSEFYENGAASTYWSPTTNPTTQESALTYIPETPWNEAKGADKSSTTGSGLSGLWSDSGGISAYYLTPSWQRGPGVPTTDPTLTGGDWLVSYNLTTPGSGYITAPTVTFTGGGCATEPAATSTISGGAVSDLTFSRQGFGCTTAPTVAFTAAPSGGTTAVMTVGIGPMQNIPPIVSGVPHRYTPDLVLNAAAEHDGTLFCSEGVCEITSSGQLADAGIVGGTSVAAPSMAGVQALINQANGGRQGAPNYIYYTLAAAQSATGCNSSLPPLAATGCAFHDITVGDNLICGTSTCSSTVTTKIGFTAAAGYDMASGLGSVNAANLSSQWKSVVFNSTSTTLHLSKTTAIAQGGSVTFTGTVAPGSGSGVPTGDVAFILSSGAFLQTVNVNTGSWSGGGPFATLDSSGNYSATLTNLPAGTYTVTARYAGDQTYASSLSSSVSVTASKGTATVTITPEYFADTTLCSLSFVNTYIYGQFAWIPAAVTSNSGSGVPTGTVTITVDGATYATLTLDPNGNGYLAAGAISAASCLYGYMYAQGPTLTGGTHVIGASYSGDSTFGPTTATPVTITVTPLAVTPTLAASSVNITAPTPVTFTATLTATALSGSSPSSTGPSGTVTFTDATTSTVLGTGTVTSVELNSGGTYSFTGTTALTTSAITATGAHVITASYGGDKNFAATSSASVTVTVGTGAATTTTVTSSANPTTLNGRPTLTATIGLTGTGTAPTSGTVSFYDNYTGSLVLLGTGTVGSAHTATFRLANGAAFWGGTHPITAVYGGVATTYTGSTSAVFNQVVTLGTTSIALTAKTAGSYGQLYTFAAVISPSQTNATFGPDLSAVNFYDGSTLLGTAVASTVSANLGGYGIWTAVFTTNTVFATGTHVITATYSDINYNPSTSNSQTIIVAKAPTTTVVAQALPATTNVGVGISTTLSATVKSTTTGIPTGTVQFFDGSTSLGTGTLNAASVATVVTTFTTIASHPITAIYSGDTNFLTSTSPIFNEAVVAQSFTLSVSPPSIFIERGGIGTATVTATPYGNFAATVALSCSSGMPQLASCVFTPASVVLTGNDVAQASQLQIFTLNVNSVGGTKSSGLFWLTAGMLACFIAIRRRKLGRTLRPLLMLAIAACALAGMTGCGSGSFQTSLGITTVTITGTATTSAGVVSTQSTTLSVTVNP